jgi:transcriptional regulator with XRE-family HTH domain
MTADITEKAETVARQLGSRIREARRSKNITLEALSAETGLSPGFLSRLERGETNASIANLIAISDRLQIPLRDFFESPEPAANFVLTRASDRQGKSAVRANDYLYQLSAGNLPGQQMIAFELSFPPGQRLKPPLVTHGGEEVLYLLEGTIEFQIGPDTILMNAGDCVHFNSDQPHMGRNVGKRQARLLMVLSTTKPAGHR